MNKSKQSIHYLVLNTKENGGNRVVFEHVNRLFARGYEAHIISVFGSQPKWFPLKIKIGKFYSLLFKNPDILIATFWPTVYLSFFLRVNKRFHLILAWEEDFYVNRLVKFLAKNTLKLSTKKIVISEYLKNKTYKYLGKKEKIFKIYGYAVSSVFKFNKQKSFKKTIHILSVFSNFKWYKGFDLYLKVINRFRDKNYKFILVTPESKELNHRIKVVLDPSQKELANLYQETDIFLSTSRSEGLFLPALEAMASGLPVITTNSGGINDYAKNGFNSIIIDKVNELWKKNIIDKLIHNNKLRSELIANGIKTAGQYSWDKIIDELEKIYFKN